MILLLIVVAPAVFTVPLSTKARVKTTFDQELARNHLSMSLNLTADPCTDFFEFACGNWIATNPIPPDLSIYSNLYKLRNRVNTEIKELYESSRQSTSRAINQLLLFHGTCIRSEHTDSLDISNILDTETIRLWPLLKSNSTSEELNLTDLLIKVAKIRKASIFFKVSVKTDIKNINRTLLHIEEGSLSLGAESRNYFLHKDKFSKQLNALEKSFIDGAKFFVSKIGVTVDNEYLKREVKEVVDFETRIADIMLPAVEKTNASRMYNLYHLKDLEQLLPNVEWNRYFMSVVPSMLQEYIESNPEIIIADPGYFKRLTSLLFSSSQRVIANYIFLRLISNFKLQLGPKFDLIYQNLTREIYGQKEPSPRWKDCVNLANSNMKFASGALYVRKHFNENVKNSTLALVADLQDVFLDMLKENNWMDEETRAVAADKAKRMQALIGYPSFIMNDTTLDQKYQNLYLSQNDTLLTMITKIHQYNMEEEYNRLLQPVDRTEWILSPSMINAAYFSLQNAIVFPAAILQFPFFHKDFPRSLNYGAIGSVIGHEITHGFDDQGREYDENGYFRSWWDTATSEKYKQRSQCLLEQYGNITVPEVNMTIDGKLTLSENIVDNGGIKESYRAYRHFLEKNGPEDRIIGFEQYDNKQLFFIGFAQTFCGHLTRQALIRSLLTNGHSPPKYRINVAVQNRPEFAEAFRCPKGSPMNPEKRCSLW